MSRGKAFSGLFGKHMTHTLNEQEQETQDMNQCTTYDVRKMIEEFDANVIGIQSNIQSLSNEVMDIAYNINEISKESSEAAQLTDNMNQSSIEMKLSIDGISIKSNDASVASEKIAERAEKMMISSVEANEKANRIYENTKEQLKEAIEKAKRVEEIKSLSEEIRYIADNTNLISLNAAIEAARVGEAGKSFAVVASMIRELSDSTKKTVEKIQSVADSIVEVMNFLSSSSEKLLNFVNEQVINDYATMVSTAKQYMKDAELYTTIAKELKVTSEDMGSNVQEFSKYIDTISMFNRSLSERIEDTAVTVANASIHSLDVLGEVDNIANGSKQLVDMLEDINKLQ